MKLDFAKLLGFKRVAAQEQVRETAAASASTLGAMLNKAGGEGPKAPFATT